MGFIPVVGTLCAIRDFVACRRKHDHVGAFINFLGVLPIAGGVPEAAETIRDIILTVEMTHAGLHQIGRIAISHDATGSSQHSSGVSTPSSYEDSGGSDFSADSGAHLQTVRTQPHSAVEPRNAFALFSLVCGLLTPLLLVLGIGVLLPPIAVVTGHLAIRRARQLSGKRFERLTMARIALLIGYIELISLVALAIVVAVVVYVLHPNRPAG